jgi:hypothetical protein
VSVDTQVVLVLADVQGCFLCCCLLIAGHLSLVLKLLVPDLLLLFLVPSVLVLLKNVVESLGGLEEDNFVVVFRDHQRVQLFAGTVGWFGLVCEVVVELQLVGVLKWSLVWVLEVDRNRDWKLAVASVVDLKWCFVDCDQWFRETFMDLKFNLFDQEA